MRRLWVLLVWCGFAGAISPMAQAALMGEQLKIDHEFPAPGYAIMYGPKIVTVGPDVEIQGWGYSLDVSDSGIVVVFDQNLGLFAPCPFNGVRIWDVANHIPDFASVSLNSATTVAGFDASRIYVSPDEIRLNFQGLSGISNGIVAVDVTVPEPSVGAIGLCAVGLLRRGRRQLR